MAFEEKKYNTEIVKVDPLNPEKEIIKKAAKLIVLGEVIGFPTETVYGLGADATNSHAINKIFEAKNRPQDNPVIVHVHSIKEAEKSVTEFSELAERLAKAFWPGPLTMVLPRSDYISPEVSKGLSTVAIRMPAHSVALELIKNSGVPIAAPSANLSGKPSPTKAIHVFKDLQGRIPLILDGGSTLVGVESTVVSLINNPPVLLRPGGVTIEDLKKFIPNLIVPENFSSEKPLSPGQKYRHYSPETKLVLVINGSTADPKKIDSIGRRFGGQPVVLCSNPDHRHDLHVIHLGNNPKEIQANFFASLRILDDASFDVGILEGIEPVGPGFAVMNRAKKAAHKIIVLD